MTDNILNNSDINQPFLMNLTHEVRTPLNLIHSTVQLLEKYSENINSNHISEKTLCKHLDTIKKNNYRLHKLLNNIIYYIQLDTNSYQYSPKNHDIVSMTKKLTESCSSYARNQNVSLIFKTELTEKTIAFDCFYMKKILLNLISNAIKFTSSNDKIKITIYEKNNRLCISVQDTGIGIPEEKQQIIFNTFYKVDKTLCRKNEGSGMGLKLVKELVELHNGTIDLNSKPGKGTEFIIKLPIRILPEKENTEELQLPIQKNTLNIIDVELSDVFV